MPDTTRSHFQEELAKLEVQALGGLDLVVGALDPIATLRIEELVEELKERYTIVIVTHNMQQAARVADRTAFFSLDVDESGRSGVLVEYDATAKIFSNPRDERTENYITGRFG